MRYPRDIEGSITFGLCDMVNIRGTIHQRSLPYQVGQVCVCARYILLIFLPGYRIQRLKCDAIHSIVESNGERERNKYTRDIVCVWYSVLFFCILCSNFYASRNTILHAMVVHGYDKRTDIYCCYIVFNCVEETCTIDKHLRLKGDNNIYFNSSL